MMSLHEFALHKYARIQVFTDPYHRFCPYTGECGSVKTRILAYFMHSVVVKTLYLGY